MNPWHKLPFLRLIIPFVSGLLLGNKAVVIPDSLLYLAAGLFIVQCILVRYHKHLFSYPNRWIPGVVLNLFLLISGLYLGCYRYQPHTKSYFGHYIIEDTRQKWIVSILGPVNTSGKNARTVASVTYLANEDEITSVSGTINLSFNEKVKSGALRRGDKIIINTLLLPLPGPSAPYSFDYASFCARKGILRQAFLKEKDWKLLQRNPRFSVRGTAWLWQQYLVNIIKEQSLEKDEQSVGCAMLLGYTEGFGQELQGSYSRAGVTHILSVSGLHVGLVFVIFNHILFFLNKNKQQKAIKTVLLILMTWLYALLTGLAPCVQRAAFMFSFLIIGQRMKRKNNIINTLFASAFLLLWIEPAYIFDYGFQLSYLAVLGIVCLEPIIYSCIYIKCVIIDKIWKLTAVTIAAQLATGPLAAYHFHQFPTWFIPANLVVIPLSTVVMYLGIGLLLTSPLPWLCHLFRILFSFSIQLMNYLIQLTDRLPMSVIEGFYPGFITVILCCACIACFAAWLNTSLKEWLLVGLALTFFYLVSVSVLKIERKRQEKIAFIYSGKNDWLCIKQGQTMHLFSHAGALADSTALTIKLKPWLFRDRIKKLFWHQDSLLYITPENIPDKGNLLFWIRQRVRKKNVEHFSNKAVKVVLGGNMTYKEKRYWKSICNTHHLANHDIRGQGCLLIKR